MLKENLVDGEDAETQQPSTNREPLEVESRRGGGKSYDEFSDTEDEESVYLMDVYETRQKYSPLSYIFSILQTIILGVMMWQCGVAPLNINPMVGPYPDGLNHWGGKNGVLIIEDGEWWRMITPIFLHAGIFHLVGNVQVQLDMGAFFEKEWGSLNWLIIYITSAIGGSILSTISKPDIVSVGSSGAVCGLFGAKMTEVFLRCCEPNDTLQERAARAVRRAECGGVLCSVVLVGLMSFIPFVDWAAHLGGLLGGLVVGFVIFPCWIRSWFWRVGWCIFGLFITILSFFLCLQYMYTMVEASDELRDVCGYYQQFFQDYECHCMVEEYNFQWNNNGDSGD